MCSIGLDHVAERADGATGSFTTAAERLSVTQSALSHRISSLERELGETLLVRGSAGVRVSASGSRVLLAARRVTSELEELGRSFSHSVQPSGQVRVATTTGGFTQIYGEICHHFVQRFPQVDVVPHAIPSHLDVARNVRTGIADVGMGVLPPTPLPSDLEVIPIGRLEQVFVVGPLHPLADQVEVPLHQLSSQAFVVHEKDLGSRPVVEQLFAEWSALPTIIESEGTEFIKHLVMLGRGVAVLPSTAVRQEIAAGKLRLIRVALPPLFSELVAVFRRRDRVRVVDLFKAFCHARRPVDYRLQD